MAHITKTRKKNLLGREQVNGDGGTVVVIVPSKLVDWVATILVATNGTDPKKDRVVERRRLKQEKHEGETVGRVVFPKIKSEYGHVVQIDDGLIPPGLASDKYLGEK